MRILAADIGGTKTLLGVLEHAGGRWRILHEEAISTRSINDFPDTLQTFLERSGTGVDLAALGAPGPVEGRRVRGANLEWTLDGDEVARRLGLERVTVLNDFAAQAHGIREIRPEDLVPLNPEAAPRAPGAPSVVIGPGTGLGEAIVVPATPRPIVIPTEGGHADFAPRSETEIALLRHLRTRFGRVSVERVVSGPGLASIYEFLRDAGAARESPALRGRLARSEDPTPEIARAALEAGDRLASEALDLFVSALGAEAGNMALRAVARGGVFVAGGVAPRILPRLAAGGFLAAFRDKGRLSDLVRAIPVRVVVNERTGLLGAAAFGLLAAGEA